MICRNCKKKKFSKIINIGKQPISSVFYESKINKLKNYSLDLYECLYCKLIQLNKIPPLAKMYGQNYGYRTSLSPLMIRHMKKKFLILKKIINLKNNKTNILDIGSNDGTFLNFFANNINKKNIYLYGIDPSAEKFKKFYDKKINLTIDYFSKNNLLKNKKINSRFSLITSFAMFYDIEDPNKFCKDIFDLLTDDGIWVSEFSYFPMLLKNLTYDQICHEHVTYYTLSTFNKIIVKNKLKIVDVSFNEINGGSIEVTCARKNSKIKSKKEKIFDILNKEKNINHNSYKNFNLRVSNIKKTLNLFLDSLDKKIKIYGYGASTKGNIVLNHCEINENKIKFICDDNSFKHGRYTPGSNIKIISKQVMRKKNPNYLLVLIWSFRSEVIRQERSYLLKGGKLIFHLPMFHVVDKNNYKIFLKSSFDTFAYNI